jgi:hypothetical protein
MLILLNQLHVCFKYGTGSASGVLGVDKASCFDIIVDNQISILGVFWRVWNMLDESKIVCYTVKR